MAVSAGSYTVGIGGDYPDWISVINDIALLLTGDLTFTQISDTLDTNTTNAFPDIDLAGHKLLLGGGSVGGAGVTTAVGVAIAAGRV